MGKITFLALMLFAAWTPYASAQQPAAPPAPHASTQQPAVPPAGQFAPAHCTLTRAMLCKEGGCTQSDSFGDLKLPAKVSVDFVRKVLLGVSPDGFATASSVDSLAVADDQLIAFGVDHRSSWMAHASATEPSITIAVSSQHTVLSAFGTCVAAH
jgi:hypothetical protein